MNRCSFGSRPVHHAFTGLAVRLNSRALVLPAPPPYPFNMDEFDAAVHEPGSIAASLNAARERSFVGRREELASFTASLTGTSETRVHFIHGAGGIGKTTLLAAFSRLGREFQRRCIHLDGRDLVCSPHAVLAAISERQEHGKTGGPLETQILFIDGYELIEPLDRWIREELLPSRPRGSMAVLASRNAPAAAWQTDPGWRGILQVHDLRAFGPAHSQEMLARLGVKAQARERLAALGRGYPLVLALLADVQHSGTPPTRLADVPDLVPRLCRMIIDDIPDAEHRIALATCAHATRMTEDLLRRTVGAHAAETWSWLQGRPYISRGSIGLFLHDVVRELFEIEFFQRSPDDYAALHRMIRDYFLEKLSNPQEPDADRAAAELLLLHRRGPLAEEVAALRGAGLPRIERAGVQDHERIVEIIEQGEGADAAKLARQWIKTQPGGLYKVRSEQGIEGFSLQIYLPSNTDIGERDPITRAITRCVAKIGPLRPEELINVNRFAGATGLAYQRDPLQLLVNGVSCILEWSSRPAAWSFIVTFEPDYYGPYFEYLGFSRLLSVRLKGREWVGYGWDRRRFPPADFFELMARRELTGETGPPPADLLQPRPLDREAFAAAVRAALLDFNRPDQLAQSLLLGTRLVALTSPDPVGLLRRTMVAAIALTDGDRRGSDSARVLQRTYLKGAVSQEAAAEVLGLAFGTYRRHLARALELLTEVLWSVEIGYRQPADLIKAVDSGEREMDRE